MAILAAPFPYFGGKSRAADEVWQRLGSLDNYIEPFCGSCAVLLSNPDPPKVETVNDLDAYLANFWRAVKAEPDAVADLMNWPVNETDLEARHKWLVTAARKREHAERMRDDPDYYDVKIAAWWCWGLCQWIGSGWCNGEWNGRGGENSGDGINVRDESRGGNLPHLHRSMGVHRQLPHLSNAGRGVHRQRPHLGDAGRGVHRKLPHLSDAGMGECERRGQVLRDWMQSLADRFRNVRVCCGDWRRVLGPSVTFKLGMTGIFLDPPYSAEAQRANDIYAEENLVVAHDVREWCLANGTNTLLRIALCGYESEHDELVAAGWSEYAWKANGGYASQSSNPDSQGKLNKHRERIWFSPACVNSDGQLF